MEAPCVVLGCLDEIIKKYNLERKISQHNPSTDNKHLKAILHTVDSMTPEITFPAQRAVFSSNAEDTLTNLKT